jgi:threonine synthase
MPDAKGFISTRGGARALSFVDAMLQGLAPDGGLYVPARIGPIDYGAFGGNSYADFASASLSAWIDDAGLVDRMPTIARSAFNFPVTLEPMANGAWGDCHVLELFHGPTHSFKDFGARFMARCLASSAGASGRRVIVLVATSGDTGSAVADGFSGQQGVEVVLLYPNGQVSPTQERQLVVKRPGVHTFRVDGTFDDCQRLVKGAFARQDSLSATLTSANSINLGRLLPQTVYYAWALQSRPDVGVVCVPSGNLGNLTAGVLAHLSGARTGRFIASHNANAFFPTVLQNPGAQPGPSVRTLSNAMDVGTPSNYERLVSLLEPSELRDLVRGYTTSDEETLGTMRRVYEKTGYVCDPHTAVGFAGLTRYRRESGDDRPAVVLATAHPAKFPDTVERALAMRPASPKSLESVWTMEIAARDIPAEQRALDDELARLDRSPA